MGSGRISDKVKESSALITPWAHLQLQALTKLSGEYSSRLQPPHSVQTARAGVLWGAHSSVHWTASAQDSLCCTEGRPQLSQIVRDRVCGLNCLESMQMCPRCEPCQQMEPELHSTALHGATSGKRAALLHEEPAACLTGLCQQYWPVPCPVCPERCLLSGFATLSDLFRWLLPWVPRSANPHPSQANF